MGHNPSGPCLKEKIHGGTTLFNMRSHFWTQNMCLCLKHMERGSKLTAVAPLGRKALLFVNAPSQPLWMRRKFLHLCFVAVLRVHWPVHKALQLVNYQAPNISKEQLFPIWIKWCFISSDWISHYCSTEAGNFWAINYQPPGLCSSSLLGRGRCEKVRFWKGGSTTNESSFL